MGMDLVSLLEIDEGCLSASNSISMHLPCLPEVLHTRQAEQSWDNLRKWNLDVLGTRMIQTWLICKAHFKNKIVWKYVFSLMGRNSYLLVIWHLTPAHHHHSWVRKTGMLFSSDRCSTGWKLYFSFSVFSPHLRMDLQNAAVRMTCP